MNGWCGWIGRSELSRPFELERKEFWHKSGRIKWENSNRKTWCFSSVILLKWTVNLNQRSSRFPPLKSDRWWITHSSVRTRWAGPSHLCFLLHCSDEYLETITQAWTIGDTDNIPLFLVCKMFEASQKHHAQNNRADAVAGSSFTFLFLL